MLRFKILTDKIFILRIYIIELIEVRTSQFKVDSVLDSYEEQEF